MNKSLNGDLIFLLALMLAGLQACSGEPQFVYVPADNYVTSVEIALPAEAHDGKSNVVTVKVR